MKLSEYAKLQGVTYTTAYRWFKMGKLPHKATQLPSGTINVHVTTSLEQEGVHLYARVSSPDQKDDLQRQLQRLRDFSSMNGFTILSETGEIASGMNSRRIKLNKLLSKCGSSIILVEHRDRLTRFGFELIQSSLSASGGKIIVINETEQEMDLIQDFIDVITSMCSRIYGQRGAKNRITQIREVIDQPDT